VAFGVSSRHVPLFVVDKDPVVVACHNGNLDAVGPGVAVKVLETRDRVAGAAPPLRSDARLFGAQPRAEADRL
jgi:hypothetical protein